MIDETLRLRTPIIDTVRVIAEPVALGGFVLPAETIVMAALPLVHRRADICDRSSSFQPARFLAGRPQPYSFVPFGGGTRRCLGASLATLELRVALPIILTRFRLRASERESERAKLLGTTLVPARGAQITLDARRDIPVEAT